MMEKMVQEKCGLGRPCCWDNGESTWLEHLAGLFPRSGGGEGGR